MTVLEDVKEVIANVIEVDSDFIQPEQMLINDLRVDSLNMFFIYTNLEKKFNIEIPDFSNRNISVLYLCRCVEKAIAEKK
ncbi:MAG: acyl carrier protein [Alphaproteobacteria bacterium]|nr:acyl carrier protein [Alphaproteobacteria bacterium]